MKRIQSEKPPSKKHPGKIYHITIFLSPIILFLDADYTINIFTGDQGIDVPVSVKIRGEDGTVNIPLKQTKSGEKPFQPKSSNEFTCRTTDVGKIQRITVEHDETNQGVLWHLKTIQIKKGNETYE
jgi:hypothetical protein